MIRLDLKLLFKIIIYLLIIILPILPLFRRDFFKMHDYTHVARLYELDKAIDDGHFPVRWSQDFGWGYGMPMFNFYAPLPYYFAEIFHLLGFSYLNSIKICFGLTFLLAFFAMFKLANKFWNFEGALLSAVIFIYAPYRALDFYIRGALGELFAISLIPLVIWLTFESIDKKNRRQSAVAALILGALLLSHTVLALLSFVLIIVLGINYLIFAKNNLSGLKYLIIEIILGFSMAAFFLLPAYFEKNYTKMDILTRGYSDFRHHFLYLRQYFDNSWGYGESVDGINDTISFQLGRFNLALVGISLFFMLLMIFKRKKISPGERVTIIFFGFCLLLAYFSTYHASPIWEALPIFSFIQFPWRLNSFIIVFIAFIAGASTYYVGNIFGTKINKAFLLISLILVIKFNLGYFRPLNYTNPSQYYYFDARSIQLSMSNIILDYIPKWVSVEPKEIANINYQLLSGNAEIKIIQDKTQNSHFHINASESFNMQLNRFYFPGWTMFLDNRKIDFNYQNNNGIIKANLPSGNYKLELKFLHTPIRIIGELISVMSISTCVLFLLKKKHAGKNDI